MRRRIVTVLALAAAVTVAATALLVEGSMAGDGAGVSSVDAAHRPGTAPSDRHAHGTAPIPGPGTVDVPLSSDRALTAAGPPVLRPDVHSLRARDLQIRSRGQRRRLHFAAMLANRGPGPMLLRPRPRLHCPAGTRHARQLMYVDRNRDGRFQRARETDVRSTGVGCMVDHPTHGHWHFDAMASYRLVDPRPRARGVVGRGKVSFCLRDNSPIPRTRPRQRRAYYGECGRKMVQGISPGWVDLYDADTPGQSLRLPRRMPDGLYCLVLRADPKDLLLETDERNNARVSPLRIRGTRVTVADTRACRRLIR